MHVINIKFGREKKIPRLSIARLLWDFGLKPFISTLSFFPLKKPNHYWGQNFVDVINLLRLRVSRMIKYVLFFHHEVALNPRHLVIPSGRVKKTFRMKTARLILFPEKGFCVTSISLVIYFHFKNNFSMILFCSRGKLF